MGVRMGSKPKPKPGAGEEWTVRRVLEWTKGYLRRGGVKQARFEAEMLLAHALGVERLELYLHPERVLTAEERARFRELIKQRREGKPLQYLLGEVEFMGLKLRVNEQVLIPRPETEELVELILKEMGDEGRGRELEVLDLGTGSGAIALALAKLLPRARVTAVDISPGALRLAEENAKRNGLEGQVRFLLSDWFSRVEGEFDLIVANPPYVAREEVKTLPREVREHEPPLAWDGGREGLEALRRIIAAAPRYLRPGGRLYLEIGAAQGEKVRRLVLATGAFDGLEVFLDLGGRERHLRAIRKARLSC